MTSTRKVFIKRSSDPTCVFAEVDIFEGDNIARLAERAAVKFHWQCSVDKIKLYLVSKDRARFVEFGDEPEGIQDDALFSGDKLDAVGITDGSFLLAKIACSTIVDARRITEELRVIAREEVRSGRIEEELSISKATPAKMTNILSLAGVFETILQPRVLLPANFPSFRFPSFDWSRGEANSTVNACERMEQYLISCGVSMSKDGPGFKLVDVHKRSLLNVQLGNIKLKGGTDAIIIPSTQDEKFAVQQARLVVDFKIPTEIEFEKILGQAQAELLSSNSLSHHDVMVVFTDLNTRGHAFRAEAGQLLVWRDMDVQQTVYVMATFLTTMCSPVGVPNLADDRVPGDPETKKRRMSFCEKIRGLQPSPDALLEQLDAFREDNLNDFIARRDIILSSLDGDNADLFTSSYFS